VTVGRIRVRHSLLHTTFGSHHDSIQDYTMITFHRFVSASGSTVEYARIRKVEGQTIIGQSLLLCRLTQSQRQKVDIAPQMRAKREHSKNTNGSPKHL
jgi:hypothetical protein